MELPGPGGVGEVVSSVRRELDADLESVRALETRRVTDRQGVRVDVVIDAFVDADIAVQELAEEMFCGLALCNGKLGLQGTHSCDGWRADMMRASRRWWWPLHVGFQEDRGREHPVYLKYDAVIQT
jgi:hypothetical protein